MKLHKGRKVLGKVAVFKSGKMTRVEDGLTGLQDTHLV